MDEGSAAHWLDDYVFPEGWWDLRGSDINDQKQRDAMQAEVEREVHPEHPLAGRVRAVVARRYGSDDVVVRLDGSDGAIVHLSYSRVAPERPPYPRSSLLRARSELEAALLGFD